MTAAKYRVGPSPNSQMGRLDREAQAQLAERESPDPPAESGPFLLALSGFNSAHQELREAGRR
jgi:hypothetical protein